MALTAGETLLVPIADESGVGEVRRAARRLAGRAGVGEVAVERAAIVATEAARNAVRHGRGGFVTLRELDGAAAGVEIVAVDRGPGIADVAAAMRDGHSTGGTPGHGLGAMRRLATRFDLWSAPGKGTAVLAEVSAAPGGPAHDDPAAAGLSVARRGEDVCGDAWAVIRAGGGRTLVAAADGLGHGAAAHEAARAAMDEVRASAARSAAEIVQAVHAALRSTRGAAVAVLELSPDGAVRYAGIGNLSAAIVGSGPVRRLVSMAGTAGHQARRIQEFSYEWPAGASLVMHSDGLATHWTLDDYPGLATRAPGLVAAVLLRDFDRGRDDVTVVVARREGP